MGETFRVMAEFGFLKTAKQRNLYFEISKKPLSVCFVGQVVLNTYVRFGVMSRIVVFVMGLVWCLGLLLS